MTKIGKSKIKRRGADTNVYMIGSGIGALAAVMTTALAYCLSRDGTRSVS